MISYNKHINDKLTSHYKVKTSSVTKDMDASKRVVTGLFNSFFWIDSDKDMLIPGCSKRSIGDRGPNSSANAKIKHLKDHDFSQNVARIQVLEEREVEHNGKKIEGIYHESYYPNTTLANDMLINIQEGIYDNRSIGFRYKKIQLAVKEPDAFFAEGTIEAEKTTAKENWDKYFPLALNPEEAKDGYFYVIKEIELFEGSDVSFGANSLTPFLGTKSQDKKTLLKTLNDRQEVLMKSIKYGLQSDLCLKDIEIQMLQIKQLQKQLLEITPDIKSAHIDSPNTDDQKIDIESIINRLNF